MACSSNRPATAMCVLYACITLLAEKPASTALVQERVQSCMGNSTEDDIHGSYELGGGHSWFLATVHRLRSASADVMMGHVYGAVLVAVLVVQ